MTLFPDDSFLNLGDAGLGFRKKIPLEQVQLVREAQWDIAVPEKQKEAARAQWDRANRQRREKGLPDMMNNPLIRPMSCEARNGQLQIKAGITTYFDNFNLNRPWQPGGDNLTIGGGLSVVPVSRDGDILLGCRSGIVFSGVGKYHVAAGHIHPPADFADKPFTLHEAAWDELDEEMHVTADEVGKLYFLGFGIAFHNTKPECILLAELKRDAAYYLANWRPETPDTQNKYGRVEEFSHLTTLKTLLADPTPAGSHDKPFSLNLLNARREKFVHICVAALTAYWLSDQNEPVNHKVQAQTWMKSTG